MTRTLADARRWMTDGFALFRSQVAELSEEEYAAASLLPGWSRKHLVAHVAANADALGNLVHWAATGERTPMYDSPEQRNADIEAGARRTGAELTAWLADSGAALEKAMAALTDDFLQALVAEIRGKRGLETLPGGPLPEVAAWLAGRPHSLTEAPQLGPWL